MQWVRVPAFTDLLATADKGVSSVGGAATNVHLEAFKATDISMPVKQFGGSSTQGDGGVRDLRNGVAYSFPFDIYVRVTPVDADFVGRAKIRLTRLDGNSFDTAVPIGMAGYPASYTRTNADYAALWSDAYTRALTLSGTSIPGQLGQSEIWLRYNADVLEPSVPHCVTLNLVQNHDYDPNFGGGPLPGLFPQQWAYALYDGQGNQVQGFGPNLGMPQASSIKPWQINVSCQQTGNLRYTSKQDGQRVRVKRGSPSAAAAKLRVNITTDIRGARFLSLQNNVTNDPGLTTGNAEPAGMLRVDSSINHRYKAWDIEDGGGFVNWNRSLDPLPAGASSHHAQFQQFWAWQIGESSMPDDSSWDSTAIDWFSFGGGSLGATRHFQVTETGVQVNNSQALNLTRLQPESAAINWIYHYVQPFTNPKMTVVVKAYIPGGVDMESEQ